MKAFKRGLLIGIFVVHVGWAQTSQPLQTRIPKPDPKKYHAIQDGKDWKNPKLIIRPEGIEILGVTPTGRAIPVESVLRVLEKLPRLSMALWLGCGSLGQSHSVFNQRRATY
jgi:hypothetical protein